MSPTSYDIEKHSRCNPEWNRINRVIRRANRKSTVRGLVLRMPGVSERSNRIVVGRRGDGLPRRFRRGLDGFLRCSGLRLCVCDFRICHPVLAVRRAGGHDADQKHEGDGRRQDAWCSHDCFRWSGTGGALRSDAGPRMTSPARGAGLRNTGSRQARRLKTQW